MTSGGFSLEHGVVICFNQVSTYTEVENTLLHELVHAYDNCTVKGMDFYNNCAHLACSEIRAAAMSGDCDMMREVFRGNVGLNPMGWAGLTERCIRRRAILSVDMNPNCTSFSGPIDLDAFTHRAESRPMSKN
ncbi:MAG: hypothetical protein WDW38_008204 [Sanguina aurantia]